MKECAEKGKGHHIFIKSDENSSDKIIQLLTDSFSPVINKMSLEFDKEIVESIIPNPDSMPYILKNEIVNFYVTFKGHLDKPAKFTFGYEDTLNKQPHQSDIIVDPRSKSEEFVDKMGSFKKIRLLEDCLENEESLK